MKVHPEKLLYAFHKDVLYTFSQSFSWKRWNFSYFGGPFDGAITGKEIGPRSLHHIASLSPPDVSAPPGCSRIPLLFGMCFDGCKIEYKFDDEKVKLLKAEPVSSSPDWPYDDYPMYIPYAELELYKKEGCTWDDFADRFINQPEKQPTDLIVVVPPPMSLGMSLWGRHGDLKGVEIVFNCNLEKHHISAVSHCS